MSCIYYEINGKCNLFDPNHPNSPMGCDKNGECFCNDDPDPGYSCDSFESDDGFV